MKTIGELILTDFDAARPILEAWARGEPLEYRSNGSWCKDQEDELYHDTIYRLPPRPHTVDWSQVGECIVAFETSAYGNHCAVCDNGNRVPTHYWPSFRPGTMPWQKSRIERPKEVK